MATRESLLMDALYDSIPRECGRDCGAYIGVHDDYVTRDGVEFHRECADRIEAERREEEAS